MKGLGNGERVEELGTIEVMAKMGEVMGLRVLNEIDPKYQAISK